MNNKSRIMYLLDEGLKTNKFKRLSVEFPHEITIGSLDGKYALVIEGEIQEIKKKTVKATKLIDVYFQKINDKKDRLFFILENSEYKTMFVSFCEDIIDNIEKRGSENLIDYIIERWNLWIKMFQMPTNEILSQIQIKGLIGELLTIEKILGQKYGYEKAVLGWGGIEKNNKDFEIEDTWFEVKATTLSSDKVVITSISQLDSQLQGNLIVWKLENSTSVANNAVSLNELVVSIRKKITELDVLENFDKKLYQFGYSLLEEYDKVSFVEHGYNNYCVTEDFPRIRKENIDVAISNVSYSLLLNNLIKYLKEGE